MAVLLECPKCGCTSVDVHAYQSMIVILETHALFTVPCPSCGMRVSSVQPIPDDLSDEVHYAAIEVGAGMGQSG